MGHLRPQSTHLRFSSQAFRIRSALLITLAVILAFFANTGSISSQSSEPDASMDAATSWLLSLRDADGAFPGFDGAPSPGVTVDSVTALALAGRTDELSPSLEYLEGEALVFAQTGPGSAAKLVLMLLAAGQDPRSFATVDPLSIVEHAAQQGMIGFGPFDHALGLLALAGADLEIPDVALAAAWESQGEEGGWAFDGNTAAGAADTNTTALMVRALVDSGHAEDERLSAATAWLASLVTEGGMPYQSGGPVDSNSTSLALRAFAVLSGSDDVVATLTSALTQFQNENGSYSWMLDPRDENIFSTVEAVPALAVVAMAAAVPTAMPDVPVASPIASPAGSPEASPVAARLAA